MCYYDHAVMIHYRLGRWGTDAAPRRAKLPTRTSDRLPGRQWRSSIGLIFATVLGASIIGLSVWIV